MKKIILSLLILLTSSCSAAAPQINVLNQALLNQEKFSDKIRKKDKLIIVDYSKPIWDERLWVYDKTKKEIIFTSKVGHAGKSGIIYATDFSNEPRSQKSSVGSFVTLGTYNGKFGYSLKVDGLEKNKNDMVIYRSIIIHKMNGHPWSYGCFTIPKEKVKEFIDLVKDGVFLYVYN